MSRRYLLKHFVLLRCLLLAVYVSVLSLTRPYDVIVVDQVSVVIPVLKALTTSKIVFYCHFPDLLLSKRPSTMHKVYRAPIDWMEQTTTGQADRILVNSGFTQQVFADTFTRLHKRHIRPEVLYPAVSLPSIASLAQAQENWTKELDPELVDFIRQGPTFLSINRFERKKGIGLALEALHELIQRVPGHKGGLVVAGGYDTRLAENVEHLEELKALAAQLGLGKDRVYFLPSFTDQQRQLLLAAARAVLYTPAHEHFGIVPLEAMAAERPVVAVNSGGPTESVKHGTTGYLCEPTPAAFAAAMEKLLVAADADRMGVAARRHVQAGFSRSAFGDRLEAYYEQLAPRVPCPHPCCNKKEKEDGKGKAKGAAKR